VDQAAFALHSLVLRDDFKIDKTTLAGCDLGSRSADIIAALWPQQVKTLVSVTGYLIANLAADQNRTTRRRIIPRAATAPHHVLQLRRIPELLAARELAVPEFQDVADLGVETLVSRLLHTRIAASDVSARSRSPWS
jgi:pimeloyl-ACP methyl ester carboxylesterase